ncbi:MAG TPA: hypothetical protein VM223_17090 [Planctomycetota bacterium]|nr:hypothetical protein [Planctomycetota bacterium]
MCSESFNEGPDAAVTLPAEVFLDSSIHIARLKDDVLRSRIDAVLAGFPWKGTSCYAKLEYGNNILSEAIYLRDKLRHFGSLEKLRYFIANQLPERLHSKKIRWFSNLLHKHFNDPEATEKAEASLCNLLLRGTDAVSELCDKTHDDINCNWVDQNSTMKWVVPSRSKYSQARCRLDSFFEEKRELFCNIRDAIRRQPAEKQTPQLRGFVELIDKACLDPSILRDCRACPDLADAIIAVHSKGYKSFFTQDVGESSVLCPVLGQLYLCLPQDLNKPVSLVDFRPVPKGSLPSPPAGPCA